MENFPLTSPEVILHSVRLESASLHSTGVFDGPERMEFPEVRFGYACNFAFPSEGRAIVRLDLSLDALGPDQTELGLHADYQLAFHFELPTWSNYLARNQIAALEDSGKLMLASISFSTARGILYERSQGTFFARFLLPVINPIDLLMPDNQ